MVDIYGSLAFLVVWLLLETSAVYIHQDMKIASGNPGQNAGGGDGGGETAAAAPQCSDLVGYTKYADVKWIKYTQESMNYTDCQKVCEADDARVTTVKTPADAAAMLAMYSAESISDGWIGLVQQANTSYLWSDGTTMNVNHNTGVTNLDGGISAPWYNGNAYDTNASMEYENDNCFVLKTVISGDAKWSDVQCSSTAHKCTCECKY